MYDATRHDNEARSAQLFTAFCGDLRSCVGSSGQGLPDGVHLEEAAALILRTAYHMEGPAEGAVAAFLDCDLHVLGSDAPRYHRYAEGVRYEYAHVPEADWRPGRANVMREFALEGEHVFFTEHMRGEREAAAQANIKAEIDGLLRGTERLGGGGSGGDDDRERERRRGRATSRRTAR